jgi:hypothetical protein
VIRSVPSISAGRIVLSGEEEEEEEEEEEKEEQDSSGVEDGTLCVYASVCESM